MICHFCKCELPEKGETFVIRVAVGKEQTQRLCCYNCRKALKWPIVSVTNAK